MRDYEPYYTEDGSIGLYSFADKDVYHSKYGALTEAWEKFILPANINLEYKEQLKVLDICYGIGYNTKALISYLIYNINLNKKNILKIKIKNFIKKILLIILNIVSIGNNKILKKEKMLLSHIETIDDNKNYSFQIDCLELEEELVKLSPLFKTIKTPEEIYEDIVPNIFNCFDTYYKLQKLFINIMAKFLPKNRKEINDLLDIKFSNMHIEKEYKMQSYVNHILINKLSDMYGKNYPDENINNIVKEKGVRRFFDQSLIKYAKFNKKWGYNKSSLSILSTFLHNIYYSHLSKRDKNVDFKTAEKLFKLNFYINDARKTILQINDQYDLIFLDAFTYTKAPQLWSVEFIAELYRNLAPTGVLMTYSTSAQVRNTFLENNLYVGKIYHPSTKRVIGTIASKEKTMIKYPLSNYELGLCKTKAGIPYRDPNLSYTKKDLLELREYEFRHSNLMSSSKYMKIRGDINE